MTIPATPREWLDHQLPALISEVDGSSLWDEVAELEHGALPPTGVNRGTEVRVT